MICFVYMSICDMCIHKCNICILYVWCVHYVYMIYGSSTAGHLVMSDSLQPHGLQHASQAQLPCPWLSPRVCLNLCPLSQWCHPTISSSVTPFSSYPQSFPASGSFPMSQLFASGGQSIGVETWYCLIWIENSHKDKSKEDKQEKSYIVFELDTELLTEGCELEARVWSIGGHHQVSGVWSCPKILQNLGDPRPPSLLMPTTRLGVPKTIFRFNNSLEGLTELTESHYTHSYGLLGFPGSSGSKESACSKGDLISIPRLGRSPGEGNGYPLQCSCLENSINRGACWATVPGVAKSWTQQSD